MDALAFGPGFRLDRIADDELELHHAYIDAHHLLPPGYPTDPDDLQRQSGRALCTLMDESAPDEAVVEALMILAHTPQERALAALEAYAAVPSRHAGLARLAAEECAMWLEDEAPLPWAVSGVLLN